MFNNILNLLKIVLFYRYLPKKSAWRCVHKWPAFAKSYQTENSRTGSRRSSSLRNFPSVKSFARMCFQDFEPLPGNWLDTPGSNWWIKTKSCNSWNRDPNRRYEKRKPRNIFMGDSRKTDKSKWMKWGHNMPAFMLNISTRENRSINCWIFLCHTKWWFELTCFVLFRKASSIHPVYRQFHDFYAVAAVDQTLRKTIQEETIQFTGFWEVRKISF